MEIPRVSSYSQKHMPKTDFTVYMKVHYKIKEIFFAQKMIHLNTCPFNLEKRIAYLGIFGDPADDLLFLFL